MSKLERLYIRLSKDNAVKHTLDVYVNKLVSTDKLYDWKDVATDLKGVELKKVFHQATPLWVKRVVNEGKILLHPTIIKDLSDLDWVPNELHKKMIWASMVCQIDDKAEKARVRKKIQTKYDNDWWEEVYDRAGLSWPAWDRYRKKILNAGPTINVLSTHTVLVGGIMHKEYVEILNMVPRS